MVRFPNQPKKRGLLAVLIVGGLAGVGLLFVFNPAQSGIFPPCLFHKITGFYCPGCGSLRALHHLLHGRFVDAWRHNPLMLISLPFVLYGLAVQFFSYFFEVRLPTIFIKSCWIWVIFVLIVLYGIARNIPAYPFTLLAPH